MTLIANRMATKCTTETKYTPQDQTIFVKDPFTNQNLGLENSLFYYYFSTCPTRIPSLKQSNIYGVIDQRLFKHTNFGIYN